MSLLRLPLSDESGFGRNCAEAAGLPPSSLKALKRLTQPVNCLSTGQPAQSLYDGDDVLYGISVTT
jgi:hypothetical protein